MLFTHILATLTSPNYLKTNVVENKYLKCVIFLVVLFITAYSQAQNNQKLWLKTTIQKNTFSKKIPRKSNPEKSTHYQLDVNQLKSLLIKAPKRGLSFKSSNVIIDFPDADGEMESFSIKEASILHPNLQAKMPNSRTYIGKSLWHPGNVIRFSVTSQGIHIMKFSSEKGVQFIDPLSYGDNNYIVYNSKDLPSLKDSFVCKYLDNIPKSNRDAHHSKQARNANDGQLRKFRLAIASTIEYSQFHWEAAGLVATATETAKKDAVMDAMIVTMNRVNGIFERDLSITMEFVANNRDAIFIDTDNFTNDNGSVLIDESQVVIDNAIGNSNYDIGHTFSTGAGGIAILGSPCTTNFKAKGITGSSRPVGDFYDVDLVAHEMGHQFGAPHTFNGNTGNCADDNRTASNAYEPASGTTIMAYAGICAPQNIQNNSDAYFHQKSIQMIWDNITSGFSTCSEQMATGNTAPIAEAGPSFNIPISTPYKLTGASTDVESINTHTYTWEQYDLGPSGLPTETSTSGPLVRSFEGTSNPTRYIPKLEDILINNGASTTWEKLASVSRDINFQLTVRDNDTRGGQTATDNMTVTTVAAAGPFAVTSQNTPDISWTPGTLETITWNVAGTNANGINTSNVNIWLSTDGGLTYPTLLANTVNDGSHEITVPNTLSANCHIMVEGDGNIFFALNTEKFTIGEVVCSRYNSPNNLNISIPDNSTSAASHIINIPDTKTIGQIKINVDVTHTFIQDLIIQIQHPNGTTFSNVWNRNCNDENNLDIIFEDGKTPIVCANPTTGNYAPNSPLNVFNGMEANGDWRIAIIDSESSDIGVLNDWYIEICELTLSQENINTLKHFSLYPNPNNGNFALQLNSTSNKPIKVSAFDIRGREVFTKEYTNTGTLNQEIKLNNASSGMYLLKVNDGINQEIKKIVVLK